VLSLAIALCGPLQQLNTANTTTPESCKEHLHKKHRRHKKHRLSKGDTAALRHTWKQSKKLLTPHLSHYVKIAKCRQHKRLKQRHAAQEHRRRYLTSRKPSRTIGKPQNTPSQNGNEELESYVLQLNIKLTECRCKPLEAELYLAILKDTSDYITAAILHTANPEKPIALKLIISPYQINRFVFLLGHHHIVPTMHCHQMKRLQMKFVLRPKQSLLQTE
jgi:hypothetical protein